MRRRFTQRFRRGPYSSGFIGGFSISKRDRLMYRAFGRLYRRAKS